MFDSLTTYGIFARLLGLVFAFQFATTAHQLLPLIGRSGVEPIAHLISAFRRDHGAISGWFKLPSLFWLSSSDALIQALPWVGCALGSGIFLGVWGDYTPLAFLGCWAVWLSIVNSNSNVFGIPWDNLLLECGLWAIFLPAPLSLDALALSADPHSLVHFGFVWLSFRVMFGMGFSKFKEPDERTREGTFIFHFLEWQPMATATSFLLRAFPMGVHRALLAGLFISEIVAPWFVFLGAEGRVVFALTTLGLQAGILACGNYGIFNVMLVLLSLPLVADLPIAVVPEFTLETALTAALLLGSLPYAFLLNSWTQGIWTQVPSKVGDKWPVLLGVLSLYRFLAPFRLWAAYGIFVARGNYSKLVPVIQMSEDNETWLDVIPRCMTCETNVKPKRFAPYHPRFDHFIYYNHIRKSDYKVPCLTGINPYYVHHVGFVEKLVEHLYRGNPLAESLFAKIPIHKPTSIRVTIYGYRMNSLATIRESGEYWSREFLGATQSIERMALTETTGVHTQYYPYVFDTLRHQEDGVAVYTVDGCTLPLQRDPMISSGEQGESAEAALYKKPAELAEI